MDWVYLFANYLLISEKTPPKYGSKDSEETREEKIFLNDPALWILLVLTMLPGIAITIWLLWSMNANDEHWFLGSIYLLAGLFGTFSPPWLFFTTCSTTVRQDRLLNRQILGNSRYFTNARVLMIPGVTEMAFYPNNQQTIFSDQEKGGEFTLTSYVKQDLDDHEGFGVDADINGVIETEDEARKRVEEAKKRKPKKGEDRPPEEEVYDEEKVPRLEQLIVLKVIFKLPILTQPRLLNEQFFSAFKKRTENAKYDPISDEVRKQILQIVLGIADVILQKYSMTTLNGDVGRVNRALTARITPLLRRVPVEVEAIIVDSTKDLNEQGFQSQNARLQQAVLKSNTDQGVAHATSRSRIVAAEANKAAVKAEQRTLAANAVNEKNALVKRKDRERVAAEVSVQQIITRMEALHGKEVELVLSKFNDMTPEQIMDFLKEVAKNLQPDLAGATVVTLDNLLNLFPITRILSAGAKVLEKGWNPSPETPAEKVPTGNPNPTGAG